MTSLANESSNRAITQYMKRMLECTCPEIPEASGCLNGFILVLTRIHVVYFTRTGLREVTFLVK